MPRQATKRVVVPWVDREEWEMINKELYSGNTAVQKHALGRIQVWKCRGRNRLPIAVECSSQLIGAQVTDVEAEMLGIPHEEVKLGYAMALVRFVNLITETIQRGKRAQPIHFLARSFGLPQWLVEIRHEATHGPMPSIQFLRSAAFVSLDWLKRNYWDIPWANKRIADFSEEYGYENLQNKRQRSVNALVEYMQFWFQVTSGNEQPEDEEIAVMTRKIKCAFRNHDEEFVKILLSRGYLVPTEEQLKALKCKIPRTDQGPMFNLPGKFKTLWSHAFDVMREFSKPTFLAKRFMASVDDSDSFENQFRFAWLLHVIEQLQREQDNEDLKFTQVADQITFKSLLEKCLEEPNQYTKHIVVKLLPSVNPPLSMEREQKLMKLLQIYQKSSDNSRPSLHNKEPHTLDLLLNKHEYPPEKRLRKEEPNYDEYPPEKRLRKEEPNYDEWRHIPLGTCTNVRVTGTNLELPEYLNKYQEDPNILHIAIIQEAAVIQTADSREDMANGTEAQLMDTLQPWLNLEKSRLSSNAISIF